MKSASDLQYANSFVGKGEISTKSVILIYDIINKYQLECYRRSVRLKKQGGYKKGTILGNGEESTKGEQYHK